MINLIKFERIILFETLFYTISKSTSCSQVAQEQSFAEFTGGLFHGNGIFQFAEQAVQPRLC